jgi:hypothetical protein
MSANNLNNNGRAVTASLALMLDEITARARAAHPGGRVSAPAFQSGKGNGLPRRGRRPGRPHEPRTHRSVYWSAKWRDPTREWHGFAKPAQATQRLRLSARACAGFKRTGVDVSANNLNSSRAVTAALGLVLDEITARAMATSPGGRISARLIGRVLAYRIGVRPWEGQRLAKAYVAHRRAAR